MLDRSQAPFAKDPVFRPLPAYRQAQLDNGLSVWMLQHGTVEVAEVQALFQSGKYVQAKPGLAAYTTRILSEGTASFDSQQLAEKLDDYGAWISSDAGLKSAAISLTAMDEHLGATLPLLAEVVLQPSFPAEEFARLKMQKLQQLKVASQKTGFQAARAFSHLHYGASHPLGQHLGLEEMENLELKDLKAFYQKYLNVNNLSFLVCGNFNEKELLKNLNTHFGKIPCSPNSFENNIPEKHPLKATTGRHHIKQKGMQSTVRLSHLGFERKHPDYYGMQLVCTILGGYFGSRLMKNIRDEKGYTYGIYARWISYQNTGHFAVQTDVGNEYVSSTIEEVKSELKKLMTELVPEAELRMVKNYLIGNSVSAGETPFQMISLMRTSIVSDISFEEMDRRYTVWQKFTQKNVMQLAKQYFRPDSMLEIVCGD